MKLIAIVINILLLQQYLNSDLSSLVEKLSREVEELKEWKENYIKRNEKKYEIESDITTKKEHLDLLYNRLSNNIYIKDKFFKLKRLYNSDRDGRYLKDIYKKCNNKKMILLLMEDSNGKKFGGFIQHFLVKPPETEMKESYYINHYCNNNEDFVFSLEDMKVYNPIYNWQDDYKETRHYHLFIDERSILFSYAIQIIEDEGKSYLDEFTHCDNSRSPSWGGYFGGFIDIYSQEKYNIHLRKLEAFQIVFD